MIIIIGLVVLIAAVIAGVAGVLANSGSSHALTHGFAVFGYHVTGSTGTLFLYGIVVGAIGLLGLGLLLAGARRTSRRGRADPRVRCGHAGERHPRSRPPVRGQRQSLGPPAPVRAPAWHLRCRQRLSGQPAHRRCGGGFAPAGGISLERQPAVTFTKRAPRRAKHSKAARQATAYRPA
jgi:hypothetical protein